MSRKAHSRLATWRFGSGSGWSSAGFILSRFTLRHTDTPVRVRDLPVLPSQHHETTYDLEEGLFHKLLVGLERSDMGPPVLAIGVALVADGLAAVIAGVPVAAGVILGQSLDGLILHRLAREGISFGPIKIQWLVLALARAAVACFVSLVMQVIGGTLGTFALDV